MISNIVYSEYKWKPQESEKRGEIMKMTIVKECEAIGCSYNAENICHAIAITIGDTVHPTCDTLCQSTLKGGDSEVTAQVGACKVAYCEHNSSLECDCSEIEVGYQGTEVDCLSFRPKLTV